MKDLTTGNEAKQLLLFSLPMLLGNVFQQLYNIVDSIVVGNWIGKQALAAVGQSFPIVFISVAMVMGFGMASNILVAQNFGAKKMDRVELIISTTMSLMLLFAISLMIGGFFLAPVILRLMNTPAEIFTSAVLYLRIIFAGSIPLFFFNSLSAILRGLGDSRTPLFSLMISTVLNIILDILFVVVFKMGIAGVGIATVISQTVSVVWLLVYLSKKNPVLKNALLKFTINKQILTEIVRIGFPSGLQQGLVGAGLMTLTGIVNGFGTNASAAFAAAGKLDVFAIMPAMNLSMAIATFTGQNLGAGKSERIARGLFSGLCIGLCITGSIVFLLVIRGSMFIGFFTKDIEVIRIGTEYLRIVSVSYLAQTVMFLISGVIRGSGSVIFPLIMTLLAMWGIRIPLALFLSNSIGTNGIWYAIDTGFFAGMIGTILYYFLGPWRKRIPQVVTVLEESISV